VEGLRGRLGHNFMLQDLFFKVHAPFFKWFFLNKKRKRKLYTINIKIPVLLIQLIIRDAPDIRPAGYLAG
jgi:hypothetical protein